MTDGNKRILAYGLVLIMVVSMCISMVWDFVSHADESSPASVSEETGILPCETADEPKIAIPIEIMAHRGFKEVFPENTIFAMESAMSSGYKGVEVDVWESENGNLMISHDKTTDRMTGVSDLIWHVNSSNRSNYPIAWNGINLQIPTLTEVMEFTRDTGATVFLHIKTAKGYKLSDDGVKKIARLIKRYGVRDQVIVFATKEKVVRRFCNLGIRIGRITGSTDREEVNEIVNWLFDNGGDTLFITKMDGIMLPDFGADLVQYCHNRNIKIGTYWTPRLQDLEYLISVGADFALTDFDLVKLYKESLAEKSAAPAEEQAPAESAAETAEGTAETVDSAAETVDSAAGTDGSAETAAGTEDNGQ